MVGLTIGIRQLRFHIHAGLCGAVWTLPMSEYTKRSGVYGKYMEMGKLTKSGGGGAGDGEHGHIPITKTT